ncbi:MAG: YceI family protein [Acidobacteria bacterium]|nr:YceI family protein [Acidobacteriota bacterium]
MARRFCLFSGAVAAIALTAWVTAGASAPEGPLAIDSARVTINGTSNVHAYTASTTTVRVTRAQLAPAIVGEAFWDNAFKPGAIDAFEIAVAAATLTSPKEGLDKNMHKALKVQQFPDITFRLARFDMKGTAAGQGKALGTLRIAGVEREVVLDITAKRSTSTLTVQGRVDLLMTDYGITPPKAMLGMLKTDPKVTVTFETVLSVPLT